MKGRGVALWIAAALTSTALGCAAKQPPRELVDARAAYARVRLGADGQSAPGAVRAAHDALAAAEQRYEDDGDAPMTRDLAYAAKRRAEIADSAAELAVAQAAKAREDDRVRLTSAELRSREQQAESVSPEERARRDAERAAAEGQTRELEREAHVADARRQRADAALLVAGDVKHDARGIVVVIPRGELFVPYQATLVADAAFKLDAVAEAIREGHPRATVTIDAFTDAEDTSPGADALLAREADAVRDALVARGVARDRMIPEAKGRSPHTPKGSGIDVLAADRRVEILVKD
jgi:outer membrane protein OmpA-like peptidoglycan-associated protein